MTTPIERMIDEMCSVKLFRAFCPKNPPGKYTAAFLEVVEAAEGWYGSSRSDGLPRKEEVRLAESVRALRKLDGKEP